MFFVGYGWWSKVVKLSVRFVGDFFCLWYFLREVGLVGVVGVMRFI